MQCGMGGWIRAETSESSRTAYFSTDKIVIRILMVSLKLYTCIGVYLDMTLQNSYGSGTGAAGKDCTAQFLGLGG